MLFRSVEVRPYHEHETVVRAKAARGNKQIQIAARPTFSPRDATEWTRFALGRAGKPSSYQPVLDAIRNLLVMILPFFPSPHRNRLEKQYRSRWSGTTLLGEFMPVARVQRAFSARLCARVTVAGLGTQARVAMPGGYANVGQTIALLEGLEIGRAHV